jgi:glucose-specific phosphotransferase system IIA component
MIEVIAPLSGQAVPLSEVSDEVFASGMAGDGVAVIPSKSGEVVAPISGRLVKLFEGGHAFGIASADGVELIVHIGLDTIEMRGAAFERLATEGDEVEAGTAIVRFDLEEITSAGYDPVTPVLITNADEHPISNAKTGEVSVGHTIFQIDS